MSKKEQPPAVPQCTCPYKLQNTACHKDCLMYKSYVKQLKEKKDESNEQTCR